jgi:hypothetical protein
MAAAAGLRTARLCLVGVLRGLLPVRDRIAPIGLRNRPTTQGLPTVWVTYGVIDLLLGDAQTALRQAMMAVA